MEGIKFCMELCGTVLLFGQKGQKGTPWTPLFELLNNVHRLFICGVCGNLLVKPCEIVSSNCKHSVCKNCVTGVVQNCDLCDPGEVHVEEYSPLQLAAYESYRSLCKYIKTAPFFRSTVREDCTNDKLLFIKRVTEVAKHDSGCTIRKRSQNNTNTPPIDESSVLNLLQGSTSECETSNETTIKSHKNSNKRRHNASVEDSQQQAMNDTGFECSKSADIDSIADSMVSNLTPGPSNESTDVSSEQSHCVERKLEKSKRKSPRTKTVEKCSTRSECNSPEIVFNTLELKQQSNCVCNSNNEQQFSTPCYALNCPCYLNDRACSPSCSCLECVNPNNHNAASNPGSTTQDDKTAVGFDCTKAIGKMKESNKCTKEKDSNIERGASISARLRSNPQEDVQLSETIDASSSGSTFHIVHSESIAGTSSSNTIISSVSFNPQSCIFKNVLRVVKSYIGKVKEKPPLVNCSESPDNPELFDFSRENMRRYMYRYDGTGEKPGFISTSSSGRKEKSQKPNAELLRRIDEIAKKANALAVINPKLMAYYITKNQPNVSGLSSDEVITID